MDILKEIESESPEGLILKPETPRGIQKDVHLPQIQENSTKPVEEVSPHHTEHHKEEVHETVDNEIHSENVANTLVVEQIDNKHKEDVSDKSELKKNRPIAKEEATHIVAEPEVSVPVLHFELKHKEHAHDVISDKKCERI